jgi:hypothetical protein
MTFDPGTGPDDDVLAIALADGGGVLAGGEFNNWNGSSAGAKAVLLTSTGARDTSWTSPVSTAATDCVKWIKATSSGVYLGGRFSTPRNGIARVSLAGVVDAAFNPGTGVGTNMVNTGLLMDDGTLMIAGDFTSVNGLSRSRVARLTAAGAVDTNFAPSPAFDSMVHALLRLPGSGYAHAVGAFNKYNNYSRAKVTVFNAADGSAGTATWGPAGLTVNALYNVQ